MDSEFNKQSSRYPALFIIDGQPVDAAQGSEPRCPQRITRALIDPMLLLAEINRGIDLRNVLEVPRGAEQSTRTENWRMPDGFKVPVFKSSRQTMQSAIEQPNFDVRQQDMVPSNEYLPLKIHNSTRRLRRRKMEVHYLVEWDGYPEKHHYTWEPYEHLHDSITAHHLLVQFHHHNPEKPRHPELREGDDDVQMES